MEAPLWGFWVLFGGELSLGAATVGCFSLARDASSAEGHSSSLEECFSAP